MARKKGKGNADSASNQPQSPATSSQQPQQQQQQQRRQQPQQQPQQQQQQRRQQPQQQQPSSAPSGAPRPWGRAPAPTPVAAAATAAQQESPQPVRSDRQFGSLGFDASAGAGIPTPVSSTVSGPIPGRQTKSGSRKSKQVLDMQHADSGVLAELESLALKPTEEVYKFDDYALKRSGKVGRPIKLITNYFRLNVAQREIYHYNIEITPVDNKPKDGGDKPAKIVKRKRIPKEINFIVFDEMWKNNSMVFKTEPVFDGEKNIYSTTPLNFNSYEISFNVEITEGGDRKSGFKVRITTPDDSHKINLANIKESTSTDFKVTETQALDIILKNGPRRFKLNIGFNLFLKTIDLRRLDPARQAEIRTYLGDNKEMAFGFYQSARMTEKGLMLNLDRAAIVFNQGGPVIKIMEKLLSEARSTFRDTVQVKIDSSFRFDDQDRRFVEGELKGLKVQINHIPYKPKFTIHRFSQQPINGVYFEENQADGSTKRVSVYDYFNRAYASWLQTNNIRLNPNLPAIQIGRDRPKYFPIEVCSVIDDQHSNKKLKAKLQAEMTRKAGQQNPQQRFQEIRENLKSVVQDNLRDGKQYLRDFGVQIDPEFVQVDARILPNPQLQYSSGKMDPGNQGQWDMGRSKCKFLTSPNLESNWAIVNVSTGRGRASGCRPETLKDFAKGLIAKAAEMGLKMAPPCHIENSFFYRGRGSFERELIPEIMQKNRNLRILIVFIPKQDEIYHELKTVAELRAGLVTQCISQENERKCTQHAFVANIALKINAKVSGVNVMLEQTSRPVLLTKCTMIVGLDVTHPAPADKLSQSIAACVGTYDKDFTKYHARVVVQPKPKKEIVDLAGMMTDLLNRFQTTNKRLPTYIVIYRDGVSEGQFDEVMVKEIGKLKEAFTKFEGGNYKPKIMFLVVQKRNHTRFMPPNPREAARSGNVHPGTLVDTTITSNVLFDFYLVAHAGMIGTSRPVHYYVLYDEINAPADEIQRMTYYLSYLYPRCTKSISVPPPVMYAHLSAKRARSHIFIVDDSDGRSTVSSGSGGEYRQLTEQETHALNSKLMVKSNLNGVLYYI